MPAHNDSTEFVAVPGYPEYRVRAVDGKVQSRKRAGEWRDLKGHVGTIGYRMISLVDERGEHWLTYTHAIVALTFLGPCHDGMEVCHADDDKLNNALSNISYGTRAKNLADAIRNGRKPCGERCSHAKLTAEAVRDIRERVAAGRRGIQTRLAEEYGVSVVTVNAIVKGRNWKQLP